MKIVEAISDTNIGGAGVVLLTRLGADPQMAAKTTVVIPRGSKLRERLAEAGIGYVEVKTCSDRSFQLSAIPVYMKILKKLSPDIVNCHGCLSCRIAAYLNGVPVRIYTRHCAYPTKKWQKNCVYRFFCGRIQQLLSHHVIAVAEAAKNDLIEMGISEERISVIINGVKGVKRLSEEKREFIKKKLGIPEDAVVIGIFARLEECKGHETLLRAAEGLIRKRQDFRFLIVGCGSEEEHLKRLCKTLGIEKYVIFTGFAEDVTDYFNITDINVNCSNGTETSSLALSEGMSVGLPCVASDYGGNPYMVKNGYNGFTFSVGDFDALAKRIYLLSVSRKLYNKMSENAYNRFKQELNAQKMSRQTNLLYSKLICQHKK